MGLGIALLLFFLGIFPMYVNFSVVEKYYTNFWAGFWNLYFVSITLISATLVKGNPWPGVFGFVVILFLFYLLDSNVENNRDKRKVSIDYEIIDLSNAVRTLGSSFLCTSVGWMAFIWGVSNSFFIGLIFGAINFTILYFSKEFTKEVLEFIS